MAPAAKTKARTVTRDEDEAESRMPERGPPERDTLAADPNGPILSRSGKPVSLRYTGAEDKFDLARMGIAPPPGWTYEWKTEFVKGAEWTEHQVENAANGWEPVPASRHDGKCMPKGHDGPIRRGGMILMERDARLTARARAVEKKSANEQLSISHSMAGLLQRAAPNSGAIMDMNHQEAARATHVRREADPSNSGYIANRNYQYTLDE